MADRAMVEAFIEGYRQTFESFDVAAIAAHFAYPLHVTGEAHDVSLAAVPDAAHWTPAIERIVGAYRTLGVARAPSPVTRGGRRNRPDRPGDRPLGTCAAPTTSPCTTSTPRTPSRSPPTARGSPLSPTTRGRGWPRRWRSTTEP